MVKSADIDRTALLDLIIGHAGRRPRTYATAARSRCSSRKPQLRTDSVLPKGGIARFYGTATIHEAGPVYEEVWKRLVQPEKDRDPEKKGFAVLSRSNGRKGWTAHRSRIKRRRTLSTLRERRRASQRAPSRVRSVSLLKQCH